MSKSETITVKLTPKAAKNAIQGWTVGADGQRILKCSVTAAPDKGKANAALIELLAREWKIPKSAITIVRGETSRMKMVEIAGHKIP